MVNKRAIIITAVVAGVGILIGATVAAAQSAAETTRSAPPSLPPTPPPAPARGTTTSKPPRAPTLAIVPPPKPPAQLPPSPLVLRAGTWLAGVFRSAGSIVKANPQTFAGTAVDPARVMQSGSVASAWERFKGFFTGTTHTPPVDSVGVDTIASTTSLRSTGTKGKGK